MNQTFPYTLYTLNSGLRLVVAPMPSTRTATVMISVGTGSRNENKNINGISHFLEHLLFKGTPTRPTPRDISKELDGLGAEYNAFTSKEITTYYAKVSASKVETALDVISDIFQNSKLEEDVMNIERGVIIEEINMYLDQPEQVVAENFERLLYGDHPAGWSIAGTHETIKNMTHADVAKYFNSHYVIENSVVVVAGNIDEEKIKSLVEKYLSNARKGGIPFKESVIDEQSAPAIHIQNKKTDQTHFVLGFRSFGLKDEKRYILSVLSTLLGGGMSSRLFEELRTKRGLAYYAYSSNTRYSDCGYFSVSAGVNNSKVIEAIEAVMEQFREIKKGNITQDEVSRAIEQIVGRFEISLEHSDAIANSIGSSVLSYGKVLTPEEELDKIKAVKLEDIVRIAQEVFIDQKLNLALVGPFEDKELFNKILKI